MKMVYQSIEKFREHLQEYGKGSLPKDERYHVVLKDCQFNVIHYSYLEGYDNKILWLMDSRNSIIAEVEYDKIEEIMVCKDNF